MSDLVSRLLAAIEETERDALAIPAEKRVWWGQPANAAVIADDGWLVVRPVSGYSAMHVARNDPAAVLRRCAADRRRLELHAPEETYCRAEDDEDGKPVKILYCPRCWKGQSCDCCAPARTRGHWPCEEVRLLCDTYGISVEEETTGEGYVG